MPAADDPAPGPARRSGPLLLAAVFLVALNLRPAIAAVPPLLDEIQARLGLSGTAAGLLTALPVICMGLFAPAGAAAAGRLGRERAVSAALALVAAGSAVRGLGGSALPLYAGTVVAGIGIAIGSVLLPSVVKAHFPDRVGAVTGLYTTGLVGGAMLAAAVTVPIRDALGSDWPLAVAAWGLLAVAALLAWAPVTAPLHRPPDPAERGGLPWRSRVAWLATIYLGGQSLLYYAALTWLSPVYVDAGWSAGRAGLLLAVFSVTQLASSLAVPALADRTGSRRPWIALSVGLTTAMLAVLAAAPLAAPWVVAAALGLGIGGQFALALALLADLAGTAAASARLSGMALGVGYLLAAAGPVLAGALHDLTGGYEVPFAVLAVIGVGVLGCGTALRPGDRV